MGISFANFLKNANGEGAYGRQPEAVSRKLQALISKTNGKALNCFPQAVQHAGKLLDFCQAARSGFGGNIVPVKTQHHEIFGFAKGPSRQC